MTKVFAIGLLMVQSVGGAGVGGGVSFNDHAAGTAARAIAPDHDAQALDGIDHHALTSQQQSGRSIPGLSRMYRTLRSGRVGRSTTSRQSPSRLASVQGPSQSRLETQRAALPTGQFRLHSSTAPRAPSI